MKIIKKNNINILEIISALANGAVLVLPTDTVYGLVCDASNKEAVDKIYGIKERAKENPLPVFVKNIDTARDIALVNDSQEKMLKKKWPGKFTFVLTRKKGFKIYGVSEETIALRVPKYKLLNNILEKVQGPLAQTSANISGQPSLTKISDVVKTFEGRLEQPDLIVDAGNLLKNKPSVIIDLTKEDIKILRK